MNNLYLLKIGIRGTNKKWKTNLIRETSIVYKEYIVKASNIQIATKIGEEAAASINNEFGVQEVEGIETFHTNEHYLHSIFKIATITNENVEIEKAFDCVKTLSYIMN